MTCVFDVTEKMKYICRIICQTTIAIIFSKTGNNIFLSVKCEIMKQKLKSRWNDICRNSTSQFFDKHKLLYNFPFFAEEKNILNNKFIEINLTACIETQITTNLSLNQKALVFKIIFSFKFLK